MKYLNEILINWNNSNIEDSGIIKASDINNRMKPQLIYKLNEYRQIKIFDRGRIIQPPEYIKNPTVYINGEHAELNEEGFTVKKYKPGEYQVYLEEFNKIEKINSLMFYDCINLISIAIPDSVSEIGHSAFRYCSSLTSIIIPDSITKIDDMAFYSCNHLISAIIGNKVKRIGEDAFRYCVRLTSVNIPNSVNVIDWNAFYNCYDLKTVYIEDKNKFNKINFKNKFANPTYYGAKLIEISK